MVIASLFNSKAAFHVAMAVDHDVWMQTSGHDRGNWMLGGSVRVRTWAGGGQQEKVLQALYTLLASEEKHVTEQITLTDAGFVPPRSMDAAEKRYISCDDQPGNYTTLFRFRGGAHAIQTVDTYNEWTGPVVWLCGENLWPRSPAQDAARALFRHARDSVCPFRPER